MMHLVQLMLATVLLAVAFPAFAQDYVFVVEDAPSKRFPDAEIAGPTFSKETRVEVLVREGERLRVRDGDKYGWIAASAVSAEPPAAPGLPPEPPLEEALEEQPIEGQ